MARIEQITMVDDLDDSVNEDVLTCVVGLGDALVEIDLGPQNREALEQFLDPYIKAGRPVGGAKKTTRRKVVSGRKTVDRDRTHDIRTWAAEQGITVSARGRLSREVVEAYDAAH